MISVNELLTKSAVDFPHKEAVVCGKRRFSYQEIESASNALGNFLYTLGIRRGDRVGIFSSKDVEEVIAIFAIAKVGGILVHINPSFRENQLAHVISDCSIKALLVNKHRAKTLAGAFPDRCPLDFVISLSGEPTADLSEIAELHSIETILETQPTSQPPCSERAEEDVAAIIYTSGSTGMPKGIIVTHKIFLEATTTSALVLRNDSSDRIISATPFSFDGSLSQLFTAFLKGATLVLQQSSFARDIVQTLLNERITGFHAVPSLWNMLLHSHSPFSQHRYPDLRYVSIIGEVFPEHRLRELRRILRGVDFYIMYGTTEAFRSTCLMPEDLERKPTSVGKPLPGVEILIVDEGNLCPPGDVGEIVHRGAFVSPGYWKNPTRTLDVFKNGDAYTGDLGRMDEEGFLYFVGRKDGMIKTNGFRVSPEEVEECLYRIEGVKEAAVIPMKDEVFGYAIKAVIACTTESGLEQSHVIAHCRRLLPHYMVPTVVEFAEQLPKTATGKINRSELRIADGEAA